MVASLDINADGQTAIERRLFALVRRFGDLTPLMQRLGIVLETSTIMRFDSETSPGGVRWLPSLRAQQTGGKTLTDTARLKLSITHVAARDKVEVGTDVIYAGVHNDGATITARGGGRLGFTIPGLGFRSPISVTLPRRQFIGLSADDREEIDAQIVDYIAEVEPTVTP